MLYFAGASGHDPILLRASICLRRHQPGLGTLVVGSSGTHTILTWAVGRRLERYADWSEQVSLCLLLESDVQPSQYATSVCCPGRCSRLLGLADATRSTSHTRRGFAGVAIGVKLRCLPTTPDAWYRAARPDGPRRRAAAGSLARLPCRSRSRRGVGSAMFFTAAQIADARVSELAIPSTPFEGRSPADGTA